jgi:hypothetical protein
LTRNKFDAISENPDMHIAPRNPGMGLLITTSPLGLCLFCTPTTISATA